MPSTYTFSGLPASSELMAMVAATAVAEATAGVKTTLKVQVFFGSNDTPLHLLASLPLIVPGTVNTPSAGVTSMVPIASLFTPGLPKFGDFRG
jgi:hypothetical protein